MDLERIDLDKQKGRADFKTKRTPDILDKRLVFVKERREESKDKKCEENTEKISNDFRRPDEKDRKIEEFLNSKMNSVGD